jgi:hypothetical protein
LFACSEEKEIIFFKDGEFFSKEVDHVMPLPPRATTVSAPAAPFDVLQKVIQIAIGAGQLFRNPFAAPNPRAES